MPDNQKKPLYIPPAKQWKGLVVYCYKCKKNIVGEQCKETGNHIAKCPFGDRHIFKVYAHVPGSDNERRTKKLDTRDTDEAVKLAIEFHKEIKGGEIVEKIKEPLRPTPIEKSRALVPLMARYISYLNADPEVTPSYIKPKSKTHINDIKRGFKQFIACGRINGYAVNSVLVEDVDSIWIGKFRDYLYETLQVKERSFDKACTNLSSFYKYLNETERINVHNPFIGIPKEATSPRVEDITATQEEYELMKEFMQRADLGKCQVGKETKDFYRNFNIDFLELSGETGRRAFEVANMKWSNIHDSYMEIEDFKVNRIKKLEGERKKFNYVPLTKSLMELLNRLSAGTDDLKNKTDRYIIAPDEPMRRDVLSTFMTRAFTHYRKQAGIKRDITLKSIRKLYITELCNYLGIETASLLIGHSGMQVTRDHYINKRRIADSAKDFNLFGDKNFNSTESRGEEIQKIRQRHSNDRQTSLEK